ncbi:MAG: hypothetical protein M3R60_12880, partial [Pseudomonadota bacterium]|nr:hypothetical protein [Pseudomonadota bacterium]
HRLGGKFVQDISSWLYAIWTPPWQTGDIDSRQCNLYIAFYRVVTRHQRQERKRRSERCNNGVATSAAVCASGLLFRADRSAG